MELVMLQSFLILYATVKLLFVWKCSAPRNTPQASVQDHLHRHRRPNNQNSQQLHQRLHYLLHCRQKPAGSRPLSLAKELTSRAISSSVSAQESQQPSNFSARCTQLQRHLSASSVIRALCRAVLPSATCYTRANSVTTNVSMLAAASTAAHFRGRAIFVASA